MKNTKAIMFIQFFFGLLIILLLQSCVIVQKMMPITYPNWEKYSFTKVREYSELEKYITDNTNYNIIGTIDYKGIKYNIYEIIINNNAKRNALIFGGLHGDEPGGALSTIRFIEKYSTSNYSKDYNYKIIPLINPWGYENNVRFNKNGIDVNRDFSDYKFMSQEASIIVNSYSKERPDIVIDNHEDNFNNSNFFYVYNKYSKDKMKYFIETHQNYLYTTNLKEFPFKTIEGINDINSGILWLVRASDRWTLSNYFLTLTKNVIVIESGTKYTDIEDRIKFHLESMDFILKNF